MPLATGQERVKINTWPVFDTFLYKCSPHIIKDKNPPLSCNVAIQQCRYNLSDPEICGTCPGIVKQ